MVGFRIPCLILATTLLVACSSVSYARAGESPVLNVMKMKAIEQGVQTPVELLWKDMWEVVFHRQGNKMWRKMGFLMGRISKYKNVHAAVLVVMFELRRYLFADGEMYNARAWSKIEMEFEKQLREWWMQNPMDPWTSLDIGTWKCLVKLYSSKLEPTLRGSEKLKKLESLIFDPSLAAIKTWTDKKHVDIMRNVHGRSGKYSALKGMKRFKPAESDEDDEE